jgi:uncharacterized protein (TIGR02145 family)
MQCGPTWGQGFRVWIDWNSDNDFADAGENVMTFNSGTSLNTGSILVPSYIIPGTKRMRVLCRYANTPSINEYCSTLSYGEVEDYNFNVLGSLNLNVSTIQNTINCGETTLLSTSTTSLVQPCTKVELPLNLQSGLLGYWPFCGNAYDASENGNNGTINGATLSSDRFGNNNSSYNFNQMTQNSITGSISTFNPQQFTLGIWAKHNIGITGNNLINGNQPFEWLFCIGNPTTISPTNEAFILGCYNNTNLISIGGWGNQVTTSAKIDTIWKFYTVSFNNNLFSIYENGNLKGTFSGTLNFSNYQFAIGRQLFNINEFFNGKLDDIFLYNRVLTASEVQQLYSLGNVSYSWSPGGATTPDLYVSPAQTTTYSCTLSNLVGSITNSLTINVIDTLTWTGALDTNWHKPCNWSPQFVPKCCNNVLVPFTSNQPVVSGIAAAEDVTINSTSGAVIRVNAGANLQIGQCPITTTQTACPSLAIISTSAISNISQTAPVSGGTITYQGISSVTARGICWATTNNPTLANSFTTNGSGVGTFTSNLTSLIAGVTYYVRAYATNASGTSYGNEVSFVSQTLAAQYPPGFVYCSGPSAIVDVINPITGKTWMDRNLGAFQVATSSSDTAAFGDLYQWGRGNDGHQCRYSSKTGILSNSDQPGNYFIIVYPSGTFDWRSPQNDSLWQGVNGVNNPCPIGYRLPTQTELTNERLSWSQNNSNGAFASPLKFTTAGSRNYNNGSLNSNNGSLYPNNGIGRYWSSTINSVASLSMEIFSSGATTGGSTSRAKGYSVRCIKN